MVYPAEQELEVLGLDVEPHVLEEVPQLRQAEKTPAFRVVLVEDRLGIGRSLVVGRHSSVRRLGRLVDLEFFERYHAHVGCFSPRILNLGSPFCCCGRDGMYLRHFVATQPLLVRKSLFPRTAPFLPCAPVGWPSPKRAPTQLCRGAKVYHLKGLVSQFHGPWIIYPLTLFPELYVKHSGTAEICLHNRS